MSSTLYNQAFHDCPPRVRPWSALGLSLYAWTHPQILALWPLYTCISVSRTRREGWSLFGFFLLCLSPGITSRGRRLGWWVFWPVFSSIRVTALLRLLSVISMCVCLTLRCPALWLCLTRLQFQTASPPHGRKQKSTNIIMDFS